MTVRYRTAAALRAAVEDRLRHEAETSGRDLQWLRRRLTFTRILARLSAAAPGEWVLKGGMAVELRRPGTARATRDIDLVINREFVVDPSEVEAVREALLDALLEDIDSDYFAFRLAPGTRLRDDAYGRPAWRFTVHASLAGKTFAELRLDVVARPEEVDGIERRALPDVLGFAGVPPREVCVTDLRQQYAEKLHAISRTYTSGVSTRVKDLVDLVLLIEDGVPADQRLFAIVRHVFKVRNAHALPSELEEPPASWQLPYEKLSAEVGLTLTSYRDAHATVARHWQQVRTLGTDGGL